MGFLSSEHKEFKTNFTLELKGMFLAGSASSVGTDSRSLVFLKKHKQLQRRV